MYLSASSNCYDALILNIVFEDVSNKLARRLLLGLNHSLACGFKSNKTLSLVC